MQFLYDKTLYFRKTAADKRITITATAFSDEKKIVFAGLSNGFVIGWDLYIPVPVARVLVAYAHDGAITCMLYHEKTKLLITGGVDHSIKIWDPIFTDLVDVSGVERLQIEHQLLQDRFYVKHLGTVMPPILPSATLSQHLKKTILVQQLDNFSRQIQDIVPYNSDLLVLCQDGSIQYYQMSNNEQLRYPTFTFKSKVYFGYEDLDQTRQIEVLQQANRSGQLYGDSRVENDVRLESTIKGAQLQSEGQESVTNVVFPVSATVNRDDGSIFTADSVGRLHSMGVDSECRFQFKSTITQLHRLGISDLAFLPRENVVVTAGNDGVSRGVVAMTCQSYFTHFNQRITQFKFVCGVEKERIIDVGDGAAENDLGASQGDKQGETQEPQTRPGTPGQKPTSQSKNRPQTKQSNTKDSDINANGVIKIEQLIILLDGQNVLTVLESGHGGQLIDVPFGDLMPNLQIVQQELEKYNVDTTFPIIIDYRKSRNHHMYSIQKQNTTSYDEYKMMKINYKKNTAQTDDFMQHQQLMLFEDQNVNRIYQMKTNRSQLFFVRNCCINLFNVQFQSSTQVIRFPVRALGLFIVNQSHKSQESPKQQHIQLPNATTKATGNSISVNPVGSSDIAASTLDKTVTQEKDKNLKQQPVKQPVYRAVSPVLRGKGPAGLQELGQTLSMTELRSRTGKLAQPPGQLGNLSGTMRQSDIADANAPPRTISPYRDFLYKARYRKVQLKKLNTEEEKLGALTPFLPDDLDAIESFIGNNLAWNDQKLPDFASPSKEAVNQTFQHMQVPFYVAVLQSNNAVKTYDPRVYQRSYHELSQEWGVVIRASQIDVSAQTGIHKAYKRLDKAKTSDEVKPPSYYIKQLKLPKVEAVLSQEDVYTKLSVPKNPKRIINLKRDQNFLFYHTQSQNSQENAGLYDRDMSYTVTEPEGSHKNSIEKMSLSVQTLSQLPESTSFALLQDKSTGAAVFGHSDGSITLQDLHSGELIRIFGAHSLPVQFIQYTIGPVGFIFATFTPDGRISLFQMPFQGVFRVQMSGHTVLNDPDQISVIAVQKDGLFLGHNNGVIKFIAFPIQTHVKSIDIYYPSNMLKNQITAVAVKQLPNSIDIDLPQQENDQQALQNISLSPRSQKTPREQANTAELKKQQDLVTNAIQSQNSQRQGQDPLLYMCIQNGQMYTLSEYGKLTVLNDVDLHVEKLIEQRSAAHLVPKMNHSKQIDINMLIFGYPGGPGAQQAKKQLNQQHDLPNDDKSTPNPQDHPGTRQKERRKGKKSKEVVQKSVENTEEVGEEEEKPKIGDKEVQISAFHIAFPLQKGPKLLKLVQKSNITYQREMLTELAQQMTEEAKIRNQTEREANIKRQLQNSKNLKAKADISLQAIMNAGRENQFIDKDMVEDVGNAIFALIGIGKRLIIVDVEKQTIVKDETFKSEITSIISVGRGSFGEKVLDCLASTKASADLLGQYWVGLSDGSISSGTCPEFLLNTE